MSVYSETLDDQTVTIPLGDFVSLKVYIGFVDIDVHYDYRTTHSRIEEVVFRNWKDIEASLVTESPTEVKMPYYPDRNHDLLSMRLGDSDKDTVQEYLEFDITQSQTAEWEDAIEEAENY